MWEVLFFEKKPRKKNTIQSVGIVLRRVWEIMNLHIGSKKAKKPSFLYDIAALVPKITSK